MCKSVRMNILFPLFFLSAFFLTGLSAEQGILTNEISSPSAPKWLKRTRVEKVTQRIQTKLEWTTRKVEMQWYGSEAQFQKSHGQNSATAAYTKNTQAGSSIHMGPQITSENFDQIFGHELVHVIIYQKYKGAIPKWLEEGLANHLSQMKKVDYKWLSQQPQVSHVTELAHPFQGAASMIRYRYMASQALAEMLDKKCNLERLIQLSVQRKIEDYIKTYCEIPDLNQSFKEWVSKKAK